ncbi:hypothetical protein GCM10011578_094120 [Streptomyces fuscichromogenes]|uniref:Uncharacterized protein n=1 Tax=Streptomyces fuscichromogenes TaxID=1324013 RepID=A0A917XP38_9ACTN|nr:hypothetical protein GCM10011578_094120 [Streptomyces fuscichromogenes]
MLSNICDDVDGGKFFTMRMGIVALSRARSLSTDTGPPDVGRVVRVTTEDDDDQSVPADLGVIPETLRKWAGRPE